jgi:YD repeat-containing protein
VKIVLSPVLCVPVLALVTVLVMACSSTDGEPPAGVLPTEPPLETVTPPPPASTPMPFMRVPLTFGLVEVETGSAVTIFEDYERYAWSAAFSPTQGHVTLTHEVEGQFEALQYDLSGNLVSQSPAVVRCSYDSVEVEGVTHQTAACNGYPGPEHPAISPSATWFTYAVPGPGEQYSRWAVSLLTGERRLLQAALEDCFGCPLGAVAAWSPSGRYLMFAETGPDQRVFLSDFESGWTQNVTAVSGAPVHLGVPEWAPSNDRLIMPGLGGGVRLHDLPGAMVLDFPDVKWPARFDRSGDFLYAPSLGVDPSLTTVIADAEEGEIVARLRGSVPPGSGDMVPAAVVGTEDGFVAVLEYAPECDGTAVYVDGDRRACVSGGFGAVIAPDGSYVALVRLTGFTGEIEFPGGSATSLPVHEILLLDVESGDETVVVTDVYSDEPPRLIWSEASTHLLYQWPFHGFGR